MGLAGNAIPEFARIIAVADAFDSMTSTRSYRQARSVPEALEELRRCTGTQFDQVFVEALTDGLHRTEWVSAEPPPQTAEDRLLDRAIREGTGDDVPDSRDHDDPGFATQGRRPLVPTDTDPVGEPR
jgi:hypothetical protein